MSMFSDNAKTYIQLSSAALGLTVTFAHEILNVPRSLSLVNGWMVAMWACFLLTVIAGAFYQYLAAKYLEACLDWDHSGAWGWLQPGQVYGVMLGAFYAGAVLFKVYAVIHLSSRSAG